MSLALLQQLVELTPLPPATHDADELLVAFKAMYEARQPLLSQLRPPIENTPEARAAIDELSARDAAWEQALVRTRTSIGTARQNTSRLRTYAR
jgi:hypothetical protein